LNSRNGEEAANELDEAIPLPTLPGYQLLGEIGRGGTGIVYKARDEQLNRLVALKLIRGETAVGSSGAARFRAEAEAVARFQHPHIVQIFEIGQHEGLPYLALEYVGGGNLQQRIAGKPQDAAAAARLVETVARAIHYAHERGVIHRDLKPANVLLVPHPRALPARRDEKTRTAHDAGERSSARSLRTTHLEASLTGLSFENCDFTPKIADFGLAKLQEEEQGLTLTGTILGTPSYMAPEQALGGNGQITTATDVHALGTILYEILTGHPPFMGSTPLSTLEQVRKQEPMPPSKLQRRVPRDLETICLKCLEKEPKKRYASALDVAEDLRRFLEHRPIQARRARRSERFLRWCRREPGKAGLLATLLLVLIGGISGIVTQWLRAEHEARNEKEARGRAERAEEDARNNLYLSLIAQARLEWRLNNVGAAERLLEHCEPARRGWEWHYLHGINHANLFGMPREGYTLITSVTFSPDGRHLAFTGWSHQANRGQEAPATVEIWDVWTGQPCATLAVPQQPWRLSYSPDGRLLAVSTGSKVILWDSERATPAREWNINGTAIFSPLPVAGQVILATGDRDAVVFWDPLTGNEIRRFPSPGGRVIFSADGNLLAISGPQAVEVRATATGKEVCRLPHGSADAIGRRFPFYPEEGPALAFSADGKQLAVATMPVRLWDVPTGQPLHHFAGHDGEVLGIDFTPNGRQVATAGIDGTIRLWDAGSGSERLLLRGHASRASCVAFHPDSWALASGGRQPGDVRLWDLTRPSEYEPLPNASAIALAFHSGSRLQLLSILGRLQARDVVSGDVTQGKLLEVAQRWLTPATVAAFSSDGRRLATVANDEHTIKVWDTTDGRELTALHGLSAIVASVALNEDGRRVAGFSLGASRAVRVWDTATGRFLNAYLPAAAPNRVLFGAVALSPDGRRVAFGDHPAGEEQAQVRVFDLDADREVIAFPTRDARIVSLSFSADGHLLAAGDMSNKDSQVFVWDTRTGHRLHKEDLEGPAFRVAFSPDQQRLAGLDREQLSIWDVASGKSVLSLRCGPPRPNDGGFNPALAWSPSGRWLVTTNWQGGLCVFDGPSTPNSAAALARVPASRVYRWHLEEAYAACQVRQFTAAEFHLARLRDREPPDVLARLERGYLFARTKDQERGLADLKQVFSEDDPDYPHAWQSYACLLLLGGHREDYRRLTARAFAACQLPGGLEARTGARVCVLGPDVTPVAAELVRLGRKALHPDDARGLFSLGLAHYRAGNWGRAVARLQQAAAADAEVHWQIAPVLAMVHHQQGHAVEARRWLDQASASREQARRRLAEEAPGLPLEAEYPDFAILYAEAATLLGGSAP
jgi:serine/threonine protein kinase/WD40 repeat protein/tetratricopeptide (TPR) repeat protein